MSFEDLHLIKTDSKSNSDISKSTRLLIFDNNICFINFNPPIWFVENNNGDSWAQIVIFRHGSGILQKCSRNITQVHPNLWETENANDSRNKYLISSVLSMNIAICHVTSWRELKSALLSCYVDIYTLNS